MRKLSFWITYLLILLAGSYSCTKEEAGQQKCVDERVFWLDGSLGDYHFVTSEPCGDQYITELEISHKSLIPQPPVLNQFTSRQELMDSVSQGEILISIGIESYVQVLDTLVQGMDTITVVNLDSLCPLMIADTHTFYPLGGNRNMFFVTYRDVDGINWWASPTNDPEVYFVVTGLNGIVSASPWGNGNQTLEYCSIDFSYNLRLTKYNGPPGDTLWFKGTGRLGYR